MPSIKSLKPIILASGSETRRKQLENVGLNFIVVKPNVDEDDLKEEFSKSSPKDLGLYLAKAKAQSISALFPDAYVIGADQVCEFNGEIFDKPGSRENSIKHLTLLSGQVHLQHCSVTVFHAGHSVWEFQAQAKLTMRELSQSEIASYVDLEQPYYSCGSYMFEKF